jgi:hypothetical protein
MRLAAVLAVSVLFAAPVGAQSTGAVATPAATAPALPVVAPEIAAVHAALSANPVDCSAVGRAFTALGAAGRKPGDVEAIVTARRNSAPCAQSSADAVAKKLAIPQSEVVAWVLSHPDSVPLQPLAIDEEKEMGVPLDCGLVFIDRRIDESPSGARLVLTMRNKTDADVLGHDIVVKVDGQPWRSLVLPKGDESAEPPLGAAETLHWDTMSGSWQDRRQTETRAITFPARKELDPMDGPVPPGGKFDIVVRVEGLTAETEAGKLDIQFESCVLR